MAVGAMVQNCGLRLPESCACVIVLLQWTESFAIILLNNFHPRLLQFLCGGYDGLPNMELGKVISIIIITGRYEL